MLRFIAVNLIGQRIELLQQSLFSLWVLAKVDRENGPFFFDPDAVETWINTSRSLKTAG